MADAGENLSAMDASFLYLETLEIPMPVGSMAIFRRPESHARQTLYAAGAELLHIFPVSISIHGMALNSTVQSYRDQLDFGFIASANNIPHVQLLADMLPAEFEALQAAYASPEQETASS